MRTVSAHLIEDKMHDAETHYINSHHGEGVHVDGNNLALEDGSRVVTVTHQSYSSHLSRQVSVSEAEGGQWSEELLDPDGSRLAALVAHLAHQSRISHHQTSTHLKSQVTRSDVDAMLETPLRLFTGHGQALDGQHLELPCPPLTPLPSLQEIKRCDVTWFTKTKATLKENGMVPESEVLDVPASGSPAHNRHIRKSLPHKKRISRKLKRSSGSSTPQQDVVVLHCSSEPNHEEILPDDAAVPPHTGHVTGQSQHIAHEVRAILICQLCGEFYGEEQLKFYQHLKQHYEPHGTIIIENPVTDMAIDKMSNTCMVDNVSSLPDSIVELSLEGTVPKSMYQPMEKHVLYSGAEKAFYTNRVQYPAGSPERAPPPLAPAPADPPRPPLYDSLDMELFSCGKCTKSFRKQRSCELHIKEAHGNKLEDMGEFSEPEDLMEGIHVTVEEAGEAGEGGAGGAGAPYDTLLPHLTVDSGHVTQEHARHWYLRSGAVPCGAADCCPVCVRPHHNHNHNNHVNGPTHTHLKEEEIQRIFESDVHPESFGDTIIPESELPQSEASSQEVITSNGTAADKIPVPVPADTFLGDKKKTKKFECSECGRVFHHRNSLLYHALSHSAKREGCKECGKKFYTAAALKVHKRVHNGDRPYKCEQCSREFRQWSDLKYHTMSLHSTQKQFKCEFCNKEFARKYSLNVHRRIHTGERNYKCEYCAKTFRASSYRLSHMRTHTGDKPYKCASCDKCFRVAGDLRRHKIVHDKRTLLEQTRNNPKDKQKKPKDEPQEPDNESRPVETPTKFRKIATASTTRPPILRSVAKKPKLIKKKHIKIEFEAPNVTITNSKTKNGTGRHTEYSKFKEVYTEPGTYSKDGNSHSTNKELGEQRHISKEGVQKLPNYKDVERLPIFKEAQKHPTFKEEQRLPIHKGEDQRVSEEKNLAVLRPMFRSNASEVNEKPMVSRENTDGKMQIFTQVDKPESIVSVVEGRDRSEHINEENGFLERLTFLYNIPAV